MLCSNSHITKFKIMSVEKTPDLMDLYEYDEFDSYEEHTYQTIAYNSLPEGGVPLSVELSESLSENQTPINDRPSTCFVKAPEIFLRVGSNITSTTDEITTRTNINSAIKLSSQESPEINGVVLLANQEECVELQYENEFIDPNDEPDSEYVLSTNMQNNGDNDYEELLLEGIFSKWMIFKMRDHFLRSENRDKAL